jgi:hypothetical protein
MSDKSDSRKQRFRWLPGYWQEISDISQEQTYLVRLSISLIWDYSLKVHHILRPDSDRCEHDHPWAMWRVILWGGYVEQIHGELYPRKPWRPWAPWRVYYSGPEFRHRITEFLNGKDSWSLVLCGPAQREWGFFTRDGWRPWKSFVDAAREHKVLWCEDGQPIGSEHDAGRTGSGDPSAAGS